MVDKSIAETSDDNDDDDKVNDVVVLPFDDEGDVDDVGDGEDDRESNFSMAAAFAAAAWTSRGLSDAGRGSDPASSGKFNIADVPLMLKAATSCARAAIFGEG